MAWTIGREQEEQMRDVGDVCVRCDASKICVVSEERDSDSSEVEDTDENDEVEVAGTVAMRFGELLFERVVRCKLEGSDTEGNLIS